MGDTVRFTLTLTDKGPAPATTVRVSDLLPVGLSFVAATPSQGSYSNSSGVWDVGTVSTSMAQTLLITAQVVSPSAQTNTATVAHSDQFDPDTSNNSASATETVSYTHLTLPTTPYV